MSFLRTLGPAMPHPKPREALRAALGAGLGLGLAGLVLSMLGAGPGLIAPFGATAFLIFVVPNSPLAQPWSAVVGNTLSALAALAVLRLVPHPLAAAAVAVACAVAAMAAVRALHPPGGAVALLVALTAPASWTYALVPVAAGTLALVAGGVLWNRLTGRAYPFRQPPAASPHGTADPAPDRRLGLLPADLQAILDRLRLSPNIGVEDLARALSAAEAEATARHLGRLTAADVMSRDLVTVAPDTPASEVGASFRKHGFNTLPVMGSDGRFAGLVPDHNLIGADPATPASDLAEAVTTLSPDAGLAALMPLLSDGQQQAVPITGPEGQLLGLITRTDLTALLSRALLV